MGPGLFIFLKGRLLNCKGGRGTRRRLILQREKMENNITREEVLNRLKIIKGHIAGIERMIEEDKTCEEILPQIAAVRSSVEKIGLIILEDYTLDCLLREIRAGGSREKIESIVSLVIKYMK